MRTRYDSSVLHVVVTLLSIALLRPALAQGPANAPATASDDYLVIDISFGGAAARYPVRYLKAPPEGGWSEEYKTRKLVLRKVPAGTFSMGSPAGEVGRESDEVQHTVSLTKDFYVGVFEVTQKQWERVMGNYPAQYNNATWQSINRSATDTRPVEQVSYYQIREAFKIPERQPAPPEEPKKTAAKPDDPASLAPTLLEGERLAPVATQKPALLDPVPCDDPAVDWPSNATVTADSFIGRLRARTGLTNIDLPTEAQWEYACRAGTTTALNSGKDLTNPDACPNLCEVGRCRQNVDPAEEAKFNRSGGDGYTQAYNPLGTAPVGSYAPNRWGLYDMHGNVWEWCLDWYAPAFPETKEDPKGATTGLARVLRGGCFEDRAKLCRSANRGSGGIPNFRNGSFGFRIVMTAP